MRIDGQQIMDIVAPDNPLAPYEKVHGAFRVFGGTSGAGPHVAAAAALLKQMSPKLDGLAVRAALRKGALVDAQVGAVPSQTWGYGKLRVYRTLFGKDPVKNTPPSVTIKVSGQVNVGSPVTLTPEVIDVEDKAAQLKLRWDDGYDGTWDTKEGPVKARTVTFKTTGPARVKVRVEDSGGMYGEAAVLLTVMPAGTKPDKGAVAGDAGSGDARADAGDGGDEDEGCSCAAAGGSDEGAALLFLSMVLFFARTRERRS